MAVNILVVDDSLAIRSMLKSVISLLGFNVIDAESGEKAVELFQEMPIDIAVLDVNMNGMNGFETCRQLRRLATDGWFPVIYLSADDSDENIVAGLDAGGDAYVSKPVNPRVLEAILRAMGRIAAMKAELSEANRQLEHMAAFDALTQIPNRRIFDASLIRFILQAKRENNSLAVLLIDIDHFKLYNDHYGHSVGDSCLVQVAQAIRDSLNRPYDIASRYGGEEFGVLLPDTSLEGAKEVVERIQAAIDALAIAHETSPTSNIVTVSAGLTVSTVGALLPDELVKAADEALYRAKAAGRNCYSL